MSVIAKIVPKPRGAYSASAIYNTLDIVRYNSKSWMCRQDNITNVTPVDGLVWMLIVQDGESSGGGGGAWGEITGTLSDQTDLAEALNEKADYNGVEALIKTTVGWATKNILNCDIASGEHTKNGLAIYVTRYVNGQIASISVNGTATAKTYIEVASSIPEIVANAYILNGCPSGGSSSSYGLMIEGSYGSEFTDYGNGVLIQRGVVNGKVYIVIANGYTADHLYFYPMIRDKNVADDTYEGYRENVKNKLETVQESAFTNLPSGAVVVTNEMGNHIIKVGKVVVATLSLNSFTANAWNTICDVPEGFRPKYEVRPLIYTDGAVRRGKIDVNGHLQCATNISTDIAVYATWITS